MGVGVWCHGKGNVEPVFPGLLHFMFEPQEGECMIGKQMPWLKKKNIGSFEMSFLENNPFMQFDLI